MENSYNSKEKKKKRKTSIEVIGLLYIFLLPIYMPSQLSFFSAYFGFAAGYFVFILHILGLLLLLLVKKRESNLNNRDENRLFRQFVLTVCFINFTSLFMTLVMQNRFGNIGEYSALDGSMRMIVAFLQYVFMIYFNKEIFKRLEIDRIISVLDKMILSIFIIGWIQIGILYIGNPFSSIMNYMDVFSIFREAEFIQRIGRVTLVFIEPASAGTFMSAMVFPMLFAKVLIKGINLKTGLYIIAWMIILYNTKSSNAFFLFAVCLSIFTIIYIKKPQQNKPIVISSMLILLLLSLVLIIPYISNLQDNQIINNIRYFSITKLSDFENQSTIARLVPLYVNWGAFKEYPIFGVGNGLQGYFFQTYFPSFAYGSMEAEIFRDRTKDVIATGGVFIPSILSGYGIVGTLILSSYFIKSLKLIRKKRQELSIFYYMALMSWAVIFCAGFQGEFAGNYYIWFLLSIPYLKTIQNKKEFIV